MGGANFSGRICPKQILRKNKREKGKMKKGKKEKKNFKEFYWIFMKFIMPIFCGVLR